MEYVQRKITYRMYPNATEQAALLDALGLHCRLYNTLLEEHKRRHEAGEDRFTFTAMCKAITAWRAACQSLSGLNAQSLQVTAKRVALAFDNFFARVKAKQAGGYPRFKSFSRYPGWGYKTLGDGFKLHAFASGKEMGFNSVTLSGLGTISLRGKGRFIGTPVTSEVMCKQGSGICR